MPQAAFLKCRFDLTPAEARIVLRLVAGIRCDAPPTRSVLHMRRYAPISRRYSRKRERVDKRNWSLWSFAQWMKCADYELCWCGSTLKRYRSSTELGVRPGWAKPHETKPIGDRGAHILRARRAN